MKRQIEEAINREIHWKKDFSPEWIYPPEMTIDILYMSPLINYSTVINSLSSIT